MTSTWRPSLFQGWYVAATSQGLQKKPLAVQVLDRAIVLARLPSGELLALDDRCPHRHVPLSAGCVTERGLACAYHGWHFGADGACTHVPGLADPAATPQVRVRRMQAIERDGLIWLCIDPAQPPGLPAFLTRLPGTARRFVWSDTWNAATIDALENFLDPLHTHFIHPGLVRRDGPRQRVEATLRRDTQGFTVTYEGQARQSGWLYRLFESPRRLERAHVQNSAPGSAQLEYRYANGSALYFTLHFTPESTWRTRVHATFHIEGRWAPAWLLRLTAWPLLRHVAQQDRRIVELQAQTCQQRAGGRGVSTELDVVRDALDAVWASRSMPMVSEIDIQQEVRTVRMLL